jgi:hypothetical protein
MNKIKVMLLLFLLLLFSVISANAITITTSASGNLFGDLYSYEFSITDETGDPLTYSATLENTSTSSTSGALIDLLAFDMDAVLSTDFTIQNISPDWNFNAGSGGIDFDYYGAVDTPFARLAPGDSLTFDFVFTSSSVFPADPFALWTGTDGSLGTGIGGGEDFGQVAVSFQQLGSGGGQSDLLASNWGSAPAPVPEPGTIVLMGLGILGLAGMGRKKLFKK